MDRAAGQDLRLSRSVISQQRRRTALPTLRGPFRLRLASACLTEPRRIETRSAQPRTRTGAMATTVVEAGRAQQRSSRSRDRRTSSCPTGSRRAVAATTAAPHTGTPALASARLASTSVEPVVTTSSTTMTGSVGADRRTPNAPARLAARACDDRPAWSTTGRATRRHTRTSAATPPCLSWRTAWRVIRSSGSWPRPRTVCSDDGAGTKVTVVRPGARRSARRPSTDQLRARPSGPDKDSLLCSLWATSAARATPSYAATA